MTWDQMTLTQDSKKEQQKSWSNNRHNRITDVNVTTAQVLRKSQRQYKSNCFAKKRDFQGHLIGWSTSLANTNRHLRHSIRSVLNNRQKSKGFNWFCKRVECRSEGNFLKSINYYNNTSNVAGSAAIASAIVVTVAGRSNAFIHKHRDELPLSVILGR